MRLFAHLTRYSGTSINNLRNKFGLLALFTVGLLYVFWSSSDTFTNEYTPVIENDSMVVCGENLNDKRKIFVDVASLVDTTEKDGSMTETSVPTTNTPLPPIFSLISFASTDKITSSTLKIATTTLTSNTLPIIYFVTPTYPRREQFPELIRLGQTLMHIPSLHWIVADDTDTCNPHLEKLLASFGIPFTHIASPMPEIYRSKSPMPRGVANRRAALSWIRTNQRKTGVLYFGDDDNTFDLRLFNEIRYTKRVSMFPVGLIGQFAVSAPVVKNGKVVGFFDSWPAKRKWPVDMAGFAVNLEYMAKSPNATMPYKAGYEEDDFLKSIGLKLEHIEPKANNCTEILVWHTQTTKTKAPLINIKSDTIINDKSSLRTLMKELENKGVGHVSQVGGVKATITRDGKTKTFTSWY